MRRLCAKSPALVLCSALGPLRGTTRAFFLRYSTSDKVLYPAMQTTRSAAAMWLRLSST